MSSKAILRLLIGCVIAALLLIFLLPAIGVPKSYLLPPFVIYNSAKGKATAFVTKKNTGGNPNPFNTTETMHYVYYQFRAECPQNLIEKPKGDEKTKKKVYTGKANVPESVWDTLRDPTKTGDAENDRKQQTVPVRFEVTRPDINGITLEGGGASDQGGATIFGSWLLFIGGIILLGYLIAPLLQLVILREDY